MAEQERQHADMVKDIRQIVNNLHCMMKLKDSSFFIIHVLSLVEVCYNTCCAILVFVVSRHISLRMSGVRGPTPALRDRCGGVLLEERCFQDVPLVRQATVDTIGLCLQH